MWAFPGIVIIHLFLCFWAVGEPFLLSPFLFDGPNLKPGIEASETEQKGSLNVLEIPRFGLRCGFFSEARKRGTPIGSLVVLFSFRLLFDSQKTLTVRGVLHRLVREESFSCFTCCSVSNYSHSACMATTNRMKDLNHQLVHTQI